MSSPPAAITESDRDLRGFALWLLGALGCECRSENGTILLASLSDRLRLRIEEDELLRQTFSAGDASSAEYPVAVDLRIIRSLVNALNSNQAMGHAAPMNQPESVRDVSQRLFDEYTVDEGSVHLGGCTLEDRPILRVTYVDRSDASEKQSRLSHHFISLAGEPIEASIVERLGLRDLIPPTRSVPVSDDQLERWHQLGATATSQLEKGSDSELLLTTVVWCKYAEGKLEFVIGDSTATIAFSNWAQLFVDGSEKPPAMTSPYFAEGSHHLAATDDGEIVPFEAIETCSESGKRVLSGNLETCQATGARALSEYFVRCPASGARVLRGALAACGTCGQLVSPTACDENQCVACGSLARVSTDDPRMARLLGEYPKLDRWSRWKLAETASAYVLVASSLTRRLLIVVNKNDLSVLRLARGSRFSKKWAEASEVDRAEYLG